MRPERERGEPGAGVVEIIGAQRVGVTPPLGAKVVAEQLKRDGRKRRGQHLTERARYGDHEAGILRDGVVALDNQRQARRPGRPRGPHHVMHA